MLNKTIFLSSLFTGYQYPVGEKSVIGLSYTISAYIKAKQVEFEAESLLFQQGKLALFYIFNTNKKYRNEKNTTH